MLLFGLIGAGARGTVFADYINLHDRSRLEGVCDIDLRRAEIFLHLTRAQARVEKDYSALLSDEKINAIIIATPDYNHSLLLEKSLLAGKHVLCEKPVATRLNELNRIIQMLSQCPNKVILTAFVLRYHPLFQSIATMIDKIGSLKLIIANDYVPGASYFRRWHRLSNKSGGLLLHEGIHTLDIIQGLVRRKVDSVWAMGRLQVYLPKADAGLRCSECAIAESCSEYFDFFADPLHDLYTTSTQQEGYPRDLCVYSSEKDTPDTMIANVEYEGGPLLTYTLSLFAPQRNRELKFIGDKGMLVCDEVSHRCMFYARGKRQPTEHLVAVPDTKYGGGDQGLFNDFVRRVESGRPDLEGVYRTIDTTALALALETSMRIGMKISIEQATDGTYRFL